MTDLEYKNLLQNILKLYNKKAPNIPERILDTSLTALLKVYARGYKSVYNTLVNALLSMDENTSLLTQASILAQLDTQLSKLNQEVSEEIKKTFTGAYLEGYTLHILGTEKISKLEELVDLAPFSLINTHKIKQAAADTFEDLLFVTQHTKKETKKVIREVISRNIQLGVATNQSNRAMINIIKKELSPKAIKDTVSKKAFVGIVDSAGRRWNLKNYVEMAVKTKAHQVHVAALQDRALETGYDLAKIPYKGAADNCRNFEGMVISLNGESKDFLSYETLKASGLIFHPNCQHHPIPIGDFNLLPEDDKLLHQKRLNSLKTL